MNKIWWFVGLIVFVFITVFVVSLDTTQTQRVQFSNQDFAIKNEGNEVVNSSVNGSNTNIKFSDSKFTNKQISATDSKVNMNSTKISLEDSSNYKSQDVSLKNKSKFSNQSKYTNQSTEIEDSDWAYDNQGTGFKNANPISYKNLDTEHLDAVLADAKNISTKPTSITDKPFRQMHQDRYLYKNIDWNTWKSEFVNKILDDSLAIKSLDSYQNGAWFYYSFDVSDKGEISNISIKSVYLSEDDKRRVRRLIQSYQYKDITVFPANSKRKTAKVSAVMMLSTETQHSKPSDFNDFEQIKMKLK